MSETTGTKSANTEQARYIEWDICQIAQDNANYLLENLAQNEYLWEDNEEITEFIEESGLIGEELYKTIRTKFTKYLEEKAFNEGCQMDTSDNWDDMCDCLTDMLKEKSEDMIFLVEGRNMGWQHRSGYKIIKCEDGQEFLHELLPKTDCTFRITDAGNTLEMRNAHHDAPTGEFYTIKPIIRKDIVFKVDVVDPDGVDNEEIDGEEYYGAEAVLCLKEDDSTTANHVLEECKRTFGEQYYVRTDDYKGVNFIHTTDDEEQSWLRS